MRRDPLEEWKIYGKFGAGLSRIELDKNIDQAMKDLARLEEFLDKPSSKESLHNDVPRGIPSIVAPQLSVSHLAEDWGGVTVWSTPTPPQIHIQLRIF